MEVIKNDSYNYTVRYIRASNGEEYQLVCRRLTSTGGAVFDGDGKCLQPTWLFGGWELLEQRIVRDQTGRVIDRCGSAVMVADSTLENSGTKWRCRSGSSTTWRNTKNDKINTMKSILEYYGVNPSDYKQELDENGLFHFPVGIPLGENDAAITAIDATGEYVQLDILGSTDSVKLSYFSEDIIDNIASTISSLI